MHWLFWGLMILQSFILASAMTLTFIYSLFFPQSSLFSLKLTVRKGQYSQLAGDGSKSSNGWLQWKFCQCWYSLEKYKWWRRKVKQMQPMWLCLFSGRQFEGTFENAQWRKVKQMQPMSLCILKERPFKETFENTQWRKVKQMQPMWLCILSGNPFEDSFKNAQWRKVKQMQPM